MKTELCEIAERYGTDKCPQIGHFYTPFYYEFLKDKRESVRKVLEIGIGHPITMPVPGYQVGAGLRMWRDFFPNAHIYGADILPECMFSDDRITTYLFDERKKEDVVRLVGEVGTDIDLVIDDGLHTFQAQYDLCSMLLPMLSKDTIYIIEDVRQPRKLAHSLRGFNAWVPKLKATKRSGESIVVVAMVVIGNNGGSL